MERLSYARVVLTLVMFLAVFGSLGVYVKT